MLWGADVEGHATHVALVYGTYHFGHDGIPYALGKGDELFFRDAYHLRYQRDACTGEDLPDYVGCQIAPLKTLELQTVDLAVDDLVESGDVDAVELYLGWGRGWCVHDL